MTLTGFVEWVSMNHIISQDGRLLQILCILLSDEAFQLPAAECLLQIVNRKGQVCDLFFPLLFNHIWFTIHVKLPFLLKVINYCTSSNCPDPVETLFLLYHDLATTKLVKFSIEWPKLVDCPFITRCVFLFSGEGTQASDDSAKWRRHKLHPPSSIGQHQYLGWEALPLSEKINTGIL